MFITRIIGGNTIALDTWYHLNQELLQEIELKDPTYLWNIHDVGFDTIPKDKYVLGVVSKTANIIVIVDKGERTTIVSFVNCGWIYAFPHDNPFR